MSEQVVTYREYPQQVLIVDGKPYLPLKGAMAGLSADDPIFGGITDPIIERPPTGRQRKPRRYISVEGMARLWEYAFTVYLNERTPDEEIITPWPWYGILRTEHMLANFFECDLTSGLIDMGYIRVPARGESTIVQYDYMLTEKGRASGWLRYRMQRPSPFGGWIASVVIDMSHMGFAELYADHPATLEGIHGVLLQLIQKAHDEREEEWRKRHPWLVAMREYEAAVA
jgi:hypothetical protein